MGCLCSQLREEERSSSSPEPAKSPQDDESKVDTRAFPGALSRTGVQVRWLKLHKSNYELTCQLCLLQFCPSSAELLVPNRPSECFSGVHVTDDYILFFLFESYAGGSEHAHKLSQIAHSSFCSAMNRCNQDMAASLKSMLVEMDNTLMQTCRTVPVSQYAREKLLMMMECSEIT
jgi:hypothetical protein